MNYRIIETNGELPDVLLYRDRDDNGYEIVNIVAIGSQGENEDYFVSETIAFKESFESAKRFIKDFTMESAIEFCKRYDMKYEA